LELKTNSLHNFGSNPFFGATVVESSSCQNHSFLAEYGCRPGFEAYVENDYKECESSYDHRVCLDLLPPPRDDYLNTATINLKNPPCLIYDFGIRAQPEFGAVLARVFGCEVHAFDPSPVSIDWWKSSKADSLRKFPNYHFHPYGAGGQDGLLTLHEYNWNQVSIFRYPSNYLNCKNGTDGHCEMRHADQAPVHIPIKTLATIRQELGHVGRTIDILKLDVEGSEFAFLENAFDTHGGCPDFIKQLPLEWHHMAWDERYGEDSSPSINVIATLLHTCGLELFWKYGSWPSSDRIYNEMGMHNIRYDLASFMRRDNSNKL
jgi:FkbM family methyltransferase